MFPNNLEDWTCHSSSFSNEDTNASSESASVHKSRQFHLSEARESEVLNRHDTMSEDEMLFYHHLEEQEGSIDGLEPNCPILSQPVSPRPESHNKDIQIPLENFE